MEFNLLNMNSYQIDVLKEVSNIGSGNAATALSKLLKRRVNIGVPQIELVEFSKTGERFGDEERLVVGVVIELTGDINGLVLLIFDFSDSKKLLEVLMNKEFHSIKELDELALSALRETGNILAGAYMTALSKLTNLTIKCSFPDISIDMVGSILSIPAVWYAQIADKIIYIDNSFDEGEDNIKANMFLVLESKSFETLFRVLGADN